MGREVTPTAARGDPFRRKLNRQHGRAAERARAQAIEGDIRIHERERLDRRLHADLRRRREKFLAIATRLVGDGTQVRSPHRSSKGKAGMSLMWMPAQTTIPPGRTAFSVVGTSDPTGANRIAASSGSGGASWLPCADAQPSDKASARVARAAEHATLGQIAQNRDRRLRGYPLDLARDEPIEHDIPDDEDALLWEASEDVLETLSVHRV